jgi:anti-sigma factor RsiW
MNCRECVDFLIDYLEGRLPASQSTVFEQHLQRCPPCLAYMETYQLSVRIGRDVCAREAECTEPMPEALVKAILAARKG